MRKAPPKTDNLPAPIIDKPEATSEDDEALVGQAVLRASVGGIAGLIALAYPALGIPLALAASLGGDYAASKIESPIFRRVNDWVDYLNEGIESLKAAAAAQEQSLDDVHQKIQDLRFYSEEFTSAVIQATRTAIGSHREEKWYALRNAVLNVAAGSDVPPDHQEWFLLLLDRLTPEHLLLIDLAEDPMGWCQKKGVPLANTGLMLRGLKEAVKKQFDSPILGPYYYEQLVKDLQSWGMIGEDPLKVHEVYTLDEGLRQRQAITAIGDHFYRFVLRGPLDYPKQP